MKLKFFYIIILIIALFSVLSSMASAQEKHISLLAVSDEGGNYSGSVVDLYLDIEPGSGNVFIDMEPLSKIDTQMSIKFAKNIACKIANIDCSKYDFFYKIKSSSVIVGGPSAGAAITLITLATLENKEIDPGVTITGTINSGQIIGPVSGVKEKIDAAKEKGLKKVLISSSISKLFYKENNTMKNISISNYSREKNIEIIPVTFIEEAFAILTNTKYEEKNTELKVNEKYLSSMKDISERLCNRSLALEKNAKEKNISISNESEKLLENENNATKNKKYYSAASYCFNYNVETSEKIYLSENTSKKQFKNDKIKLTNEINDFKKKIKSIKC